MPLRLFRLLAATALSATAVVGVPTPAQAATCSSDTGVSVVVDYSGAGGEGIAGGCVAGGGGDSASALFGAAGHALTRVNSQPGAVCKVDGLRESDTCAQMPPTNAYWGLFWANGSGGWVYSTEGVDSLNVPDGGSVAFAWQDGGDYNYPGVAAPRHEESEPSPQPEPSNNQPGSGGGTGGGNGSGSAPGTPPSTAPATPDATGTGGPSAGPSEGDRKERTRDRDPKEPEESKDSPKGPKTEKGEVSESASPESSQTDASPTARPPAVEDDALPAWVAPVAVGGLFGIAGIIALLRRRTTA